MDNLTAFLTERLKKLFSTRLLGGGASIGVSVDRLDGWPLAAVVILTTVAYVASETWLKTRKTA